MKNSDLKEAYERFLKAHNLTNSKKAYDLWISQRSVFLKDYRPIKSITVDKNCCIIDVKH